MPQPVTAFKGDPRFSIRFQISGDPLVWKGWNKNIMKDLGQVVADSTRERIQQRSENGFGAPLGLYRTDVGRNPKTRGRKGKPIILTDTGRMMKTWKPRQAQKTRVRITTLAAYGDDVNTRYQWAWIDEVTMERLTDRFNSWVNSLLGANNAPATPSGVKVKQGQPVFL